MYCPKCGAYNEDTNKFCTKCGQPLTRATASMPTASKRGGRGLLAVALGIIVVLTILAASWAGLRWYQNYRAEQRVKHYQEGLRALQHKAWDEAMGEFQAAGDYGDAEAKLADAEFHLILERTSHRLEEVRNFHYTVDVRTEWGTYSYEGDYQSPDRMWLKVVDTENPEAWWETVVIENTAYAREPGKEWGETAELIEQPALPKRGIEQGLADTFQALADDEAVKRYVWREDEEEIGGVLCYHVHVDWVERGIEPELYTLAGVWGDGLKDSEFWISTEDYSLIKAAHREQDLLLTWEFSEYNQAAMVKAPSIPSTPTPEAVIRIGLDVPMTGDIAYMGTQSQRAAEMKAEEINAAGGLEVGGERYKINIIIADNESKAESATAAAVKLIMQDKVLAIVGPQASKQAVPTGEVANANEVVMISPWSTNPRTTQNRPWVFRACFLDSLQGPVLANFATKEFGFTKAAVLYDIASDYPKGLAQFFKDAWEEIHGPGSVVAFESFTTGDRDFSAQLTKIKGTDAEVLFTPQYYNEVPLIVKQAQEQGLPQVIVGSDSWGDPKTLELCGDACEGMYFSTHYAAEGATGATKGFIDKYKAKYDETPGDVAALTWDAMRIVGKALQDCGNITGDLAKDRKCLRNALAEIKNFDGITGKMIGFTEEGDPIKCAVIAKINSAHKSELYKRACP